ncbi:hypothetical protein NWUPM366V_123 [Escherichia phage vB_EcoM_366V_SA_NWU]|nr:hypothetical protein NWUPM12A_160 [Escherichia phage vB_EcoM_12A_SA_NWU]WIL79698.1 hypothetical protein NWUPM366V_123 [Escherichia phage vB_EcoM_366V_SA_NWU]
MLCWLIFRYLYKLNYAVRSTITTVWGISPSTTSKAFFCVIDIFTRCSVAVKSFISSRGVLVQYQISGLPICKLRKNSVLPVLLVIICQPHPIPLEDKIILDMVAIRPIPRAITKITASINFCFMVFILFC